MNRTEDMVRMYGEVVRKAQAGRILNHHPNTITQMVEDGRLRTACGGTMIDVRSIAEYIESPARHDEAARQVRMGRKWSV